MDILQRIDRDKAFLNSCYLMDYSLLIMFFNEKQKSMHMNRGVTISIKVGEQDEKYIEIMEESKVEGSAIEEISNEDNFEGMISPKVGFK